MTRGRALLAVVVTVAVTFALAALPWFSSTVTQAVGETRLSVSGTAAAPVIGALLLVVAAGLVAFLLARGALARVVAVVMALAGLGVVAASLVTVQDPASPLRAAAADLTGVPELAGDVAVTPWGWACAAAGALLTAACVALAATRPPERTSSRYERAAPAGSSAPTAPTTGGSTTAAPPQRDAIDDWDALTRGEDPTGGAGATGEPGSAER